MRDALRGSQKPQCLDWEAPPVHHGRPSLSMTRFCGGSFSLSRKISKTRAIVYELSFQTEIGGRFLDEVPGRLLVTCFSHVSYSFCCAATFTRKGSQITHISRSQSPSLLLIPANMLNNGGWYNGKLPRSQGDSSYASKVSCHLCSLLEVLLTFPHLS